MKVPALQDDPRNWLRGVPRIDPASSSDTVNLGAA
jgi:hypothetical protein